MRRSEKEYRRHIILEVGRWSLLGSDKSIKKCDGCIKIVISTLMNAKTCGCEILLRVIHRNFLKLCLGMGLGPERAH